MSEFGIRQTRCTLYLIFSFCKTFRIVCCSYSGGRKWEVVLKRTTPPRLRPAWPRPARLRPAPLRPASLCPNPPRPARPGLAPPCPPRPARGVSGFGFNLLKANRDRALGVSGFLNRQKFWKHKYVQIYCIQEWPPRGYYANHPRSISRSKLNLRKNTQNLRPVLGQCF